MALVRGEGVFENDVSANRAQDKPKQVDGVVRRLSFFKKPQATVNEDEHQAVEKEMIAHIEQEHKTHQEDSDVEELETQ